MRKNLLPVMVVLCLCLAACGAKEPRLREEPFEGQISSVEGIEIRITRAVKEQITYEISNTSDMKFCYEGHHFATLQKEREGLWYDLQFRDDYAATADFRFAEIPVEPEEHTLSIRDTYGEKLTAGKYRLIAVGYPSFEELEQMDPAGAIYLAEEFTIQ